MYRHPSAGAPPVQLKLDGIGGDGSNSVTTLRVGDDDKQHSNASNANVIRARICVRRLCTLCSSSCCWCQSFCCGVSTTLLLLLLALIVAIALFRSRTVDLDDSATPFSLQRSSIDAYALRHPPRSHATTSQLALSDAPHLYDLQSSSAPAAFAAPQMLLRHDTRTHMRASKCAPGYEQHSRMSRLTATEWLRGVWPRANSGDGEPAPSSSYKNGDGSQCVRTFYGLRTADSALVDVSVNPCDNPYQHACGRWLQFFNASQHRVDDLSPEIYHQRFGELLGASLSDYDSVVHVFHSGGRFRCVDTLVSTHNGLVDSDEWRTLQRQWSAVDVLAARSGTAHITRWLEIIRATNALGVLTPWLEDEQRSVLCSLYALHQRGVFTARTLTLACIALAMPAEECDNAEEWLDTLEAVVHSTMHSQCNHTVLTHGSQGDGAIVQTDEFFSLEHDALSFDRFVRYHCGDNDQRVAALWRLCAAVSAFGSLYSGVDSDSALFATDDSVSPMHVLRLRFAMPTDDEQFFSDAHCRRLARVGFAEALQDRYAALLLGRRARTATRSTLTAIEVCTAHTPLALKMNIYERPHAERSQSTTCIQQYATRSHPLLTLIVAQRCLAHTRRRSAQRQLLLEMHIPVITIESATPQAVGIVITPAMLTHPWFTYEMSIESVVARLYFLALRVATRSRHTDSCDDTLTRDRQALGMLEQCFPTLLDSVFWIDMMQLMCSTLPQCEVPAAVHLLDLTDTVWSAHTRSLHACTPQQLTNAQRWSRVLREDSVYRKAFQCSRIN